MVTRKKNTPHTVTVRAYDVGFGDCFLVTFEYSNGPRHVLIDFGSTRYPSGKRINGKVVKSHYLDLVADQIKADCGGKLDVVVATHRHKDHIGGFERGGGTGPGEIIRSLKPRLVIQPWTEDPKAARDATKPTRALHIATLKDIEAAAQSAGAAAKSLRGERFHAVRAELEAIGMEGIGNRDAVENLETMATNRYVYFGCSAGLGKILPGVRLRVLGPPTIEQTSAILRQRDEDPDEFWLARASGWKRLARTVSKLGAGEPLFPEVATQILRRSARWFRYTVRQEWAQTQLSIVRAMDAAMNNTSVILLFEVGGKRFLFPGDAQYEDWMYALEQDDVLQELSGVDLYKVGHHGSRNATPRTLWEGFVRRGAKSKRRRLVTVLSTKAGVHGHADERHSEVPRSTLIQALKKESSLIDTQNFAEDELSRSVSVRI